MNRKQPTFVPLPPLFQTSCIPPPLHQRRRAAPEQQNLTLSATQPSRHPMPTARKLNDSSPSPQPVSRRVMLSVLAGTLTATLATRADAGEYNRLPMELYDANKSRRYVDIGRPEPDRSRPAFDASKAVFAIDDNLNAQDISLGSGERSVGKGNLVVARWSILLDDGTTVDEFNEKRAAMFRPGAHQVPPGIEDAVIGMRPGGVRRVKGTSERVLSNITMGYDIGERSLVPNGSTVFIELRVDSIDPYGTR